MASLKKLKQYSLAELINIGFHKTMLRTKLKLESIILSGREYERFKPLTIPKIPTLKPIYDIFIKPDMPKADKIVDGEIELFNKWYLKQNWLKDPISGNLWPAHDFFASSSTKLNGYGDVKFVLETNKLNHLVTVATAYHKTKQQKYISYIEQEIASWCSEVHYERSVANKIIMDVAFRAINLISISIICSENKYFITNIYPTIHKILLLSERQISKFSTPKWFKTGNGANHVIGEMVGLIIIRLWKAIISNKNKSLNLKSEYKWLYDTLDKLISPNGIYLEQSANYSRLVCEFLVMLDIFENAANLHTKTRDYLKPLIGYVSDLFRIDSHLNFGDNDGASVLIAFKNNISDISPLLKYHQIYLNKNTSTNLNRYNNNGQFLWQSNDSNQISLFIRHGRFNYFREGAAAHAHCDLLAILMSIKGIPIFVDKGSYLYNSDKKQRFNDVSIKSHNTITVDNIEMASFDGKGFYIYPESKFSHSDIHNSCIFSASIKYSDIIHIRKIHYSLHELEIIDSISYFEGKEFTLRFLLSEYIIPEIEKNSTIINLYYQNNIIATMTFENIDFVHCEADSYSPFYANKLDTHAIIAKGKIKNNKNIITKFSF